MKILVIDDDQAMTELLTLLLKPVSSIVIPVHSGSQGVELTRTEKPDLVTLDLMMPEMSGWEVCKSIRQFSSVPILILSALDSPGLVAAALDAGADDYMIKPVTSSSLMAHINRLVRRTAISNGIAYAPSH